MQEYIEAKVNGKKVFDDFIDTGDWYKQDLTCCLFGEKVLVLGLTTGSLGELSYAFYLYKIFAGKKEKVKLGSESIHPKIIAGKNFPFTVLAYRPFIKDKLPYELEKYIKRFGGILKYIKNTEELKNEL